MMTDTEGKSIDTLNKIKKFFSALHGFTSIFGQKNNSGRVIVVFAVVALGVTGYLAFSLFSTLAHLKSQTPTLASLTTYDTTPLSTNRVTKSVLDFSSTLYDLVDKNIEIKEDIKKYNGYMEALQLPYDYFLKYLYLPSLNVWKDDYTQKIDLNLIGVNFLKKNPYNDVVLLQQWSDFFKNVGNNEFNEVSNIRIGNIVETEDGYFYIPISVSFKANSKRSFLMLVDKLSLTSNRENIALINEFFYYLWDEIKQQKASEITSLVQTYNEAYQTEADDDVVIGYHLYHWIFDNQPNMLIDAGVLESTIKGLMYCTALSTEQCYYEFRDKYRDLSKFAYAVSSDVTYNVVESFKSFFAQFPPIIALDDFTFDKVVSMDLANFDRQIYQGTVAIRVYGKGILSEEVDQISLLLGNKCLAQDKKISPQDALVLIDAAIMQQSDIAGANRGKTQDLWELREILDVISTEYEGLSNYKKIIRLFEIDRMLDDAGLCE